ncbi:MAG: PEP-CTERM sorting domain-containing protein [Desulfobacteraceae bacterium]|nr:MAG: PEP-CTERM sorting domain-containing protein [Desulfobacteraceae bacterium]
MKKILTALTVFLFVIMGFAGGAQAYSITTYSNYLSWLDAIDPNTYVNENFEDTTLEPNFSITEIGGTGTIAFGLYTNIVDSIVPRYQIFNYATGMYAFGGFFNLNDPGGPGSSIDVYINDDNTFVMNIPAIADDFFYGFVTDGSFLGVRFEEYAQAPAGYQETYYGIDVSLAAVPEPTTLLLLGFGLIGLAGVSRKLKK